MHPRHLFGQPFGREEALSRHPVLEVIADDMREGSLPREWAIYLGGDGAIDSHLPDQVSGTAQHRVADIQTNKFVSHLQRPRGRRSPSSIQTFQ